MLYKLESYMESCQNCTGDLLITNQTNEERRSKFNSTGCSHGGFAGVFDDSICGSIASSCAYINSRHNYVTINARTVRCSTIQSHQRAACAGRVETWVGDHTSSKGRFVLRFRFNTNCFLLSTIHPKPPESRNRMVNLTYPQMRLNIFPNDTERELKKERC